MRSAVNKQIIVQRKAKIVHNWDRKNKWAQRTEWTLIRGQKGRTNTFTARWWQFECRAIYYYLLSGSSSLYSPLDGAVWLENLARFLYCPVLRTTFTGARYWLTFADNRQWLNLQDVRHGTFYRWKEHILDCCFWISLFLLSMEGPRWMLKHEAQSLK